MIIVSAISATCIHQALIPRTNHQSGLKQLLPGAFFYPQDEAELNHSVEEFFEAIRFEHREKLSELPFLALEFD
jgi:hypothetical protein